YICILIDSCCFFSSRRRHTRSKRDWSSDVCSSDLILDDETAQNIDNFYTEDMLKDWATYDPAGAEEVTAALQDRQAGAVLYGMEIGRASCRERVESAEGGEGVRERETK